MMKLYFVRHGESEANTRHIISNHESLLGLTLVGKGQAQALADKLSEVPISAIYCSPVFRARQTADILSASFDVASEVTEALREYDCGVLEDQSDEESWRLHREYFDSWTLHHHFQNKPAGGESFLDIQKRFLPFIENLTHDRAYKEKNVLLIGHGGLFHLMLPLILTNIDNEFVRLHRIEHTECVIAESSSSQLICKQWGEIEF